MITYNCCHQKWARLQAPGDSNELCIVEGQLSWIVHIIAAILKMRQVTGSRYYHHLVYNII